jgi:hypothetical protein
MAATGTLADLLDREMRRRGWTLAYFWNWRSGRVPPGPTYRRLIARALDLPVEVIVNAIVLQQGIKAREVGDASMESAVFFSQPSNSGGLSILTDHVIDLAARFDGLGAASAPPHPIDPFAILGYGLLDDANPGLSQLELGGLRERVNAARRGFQGCRYADVAAVLPQILADLNAATKTLSGDHLLATHALSAEAQHIAASLLLKHDDHGLAWIAADRSMHAAERSGNAQVIAASARIVTHAMMSAGYHAAATATAAKLALRFSTDWTSPTGDDLSAYGSLVLRGATAAARGGDRHMARDLLDEAEQTAHRMSRDYQHLMNGFGSTNVQMHRVHIAVALGDAGTAIDLARRIDLQSATIVERRASTLVDVALALSQCGRVEQSYQALRSAEALAPEEILARPSVRHLVLELLAQAPSSLSPALKALACRVHAPGVVE